MEKLLVIIGPTAPGKSALALSVAKRAGAEILSVDSMQVYRGMDIGTAKATPQEQCEIPHHLLDVAGPEEIYSVARFVEAADRVVAGARARNVPLIATGGTPLYYKSLFYGLFAGPSADAGVREKLSEMSNEQLHAQLAGVDPAAAARIHVGDRRRLVRALEVQNITGKPISSLQSQWDDGSQPRHDAVWIGLKWDKEALNKRINARVVKMLNEGWPLEVRKLMAHAPPLSHAAAEATGYAELIACARGEMDLDEAAERIKIGTRQLARRQMKWLRRFPGVHWLKGEAPPETLVEDAMHLWKAGK